MSASGIEQPDTITVEDGRSRMRIAWPDGRTGRVTAAALRSACRCGWCTRDRVLGRPAPEADRVLLDDVAVLGSHGLHIRFSDGHERGIFPWPYLAELSDALGSYRPCKAHGAAA